MNNTQIVRMLNTKIYRHLPTTDNNITFKTLMRMLINFIDRRRMRGYVIAKIHHALDFRVNIEGEAVAEEAMDDVNQGLDELLKDFGRKELIWTIRLKSIVEKATIEERFIMLNLLSILDLGPEPDEVMLIARNINADAINNINNNHAQM
jgi:hypothetical protein